MPHWYRRSEGVKKVLNVGGNSKKISLPPRYEGWKSIVLDIDPQGKLDVVCDARQLSRLPRATYDAVYCYHNLEHYYRHDVPKVQAGFSHVVKVGGFVHIIVPDIGGSDAHRAPERDRHRRCPVSIPPGSDYRPGRDVWIGRGDRGKRQRVLRAQDRLHATIPAGHAGEVRLPPRIQRCRQTRSHCVRVQAKAR